MRDIIKETLALTRKILIQDETEEEEEESKSDEHNVSSFTIQKLPSWSGSSASQVKICSDVGM